MTNNSTFDDALQAAIQASLVEDSNEEKVESADDSVGDEKMGPLSDSEATDAGTKRQKRERGRPRKGRSPAMSVDDGRGDRTASDTIRRTALKDERRCSEHLRSVQNIFARHSCQPRECNGCRG